MADINTPADIPPTWGGQPEGYSPGPELAISLDGLTVTVQRTHRTDNATYYYWRLMCEGHLAPMDDGTASVDRPPFSALLDVIWSLYVSDTARSLAGVNLDSRGTTLPVSVFDTLHAMYDALTERKEH